MLPLDVSSLRVPVHLLLFQNLGNFIHRTLPLSARRDRPGDVKHQHGVNMQHAVDSISQPNELRQKCP